MLGYVRRRLGPSDDHMGGAASLCQQVRAQRERSRVFVASKYLWSGGYDVRAALDKGHHRRDYGLNLSGRWLVDAVGAPLLARRRFAAQKTRLRVHVARIELATATAKGGRV